MVGRFAREGVMVIPQFWVEVVRDVDALSLDGDGEVMVTAANEVEAAALVMSFLGGGYADAVDVSPPDSVSVDVDAAGFLKGTSFMYCTYSAGVFSYEARFRS
jgi:hypothetical protein